jgi:hypothetical protein
LFSVFSFFLVYETAAPTARGGFFVKESKEVPFFACFVVAAGKKRKKIDVSTINL